MSTARYDAFVARDARFDGRFFAGIVSTGIYCRPVCRARRPRPENCVFFDTAAEAERAGFRPCLRCRPERAPGTAPVDARSHLARRAARWIEKHRADDDGLDALAARLGYTARHLRRAFATVYRVSPLQYRQTCRLLLAKNLLADTRLSVLRIALAVGFGSLRRFNAVFKKRYHLPPTALRKQTATGKNRDDSITLALDYRPPYRWEALLDFLAARALPGVEVVENGTYARTVRLPLSETATAAGWIRVGHRPRENALSVTLGDGLLPVLPQALDRVRALFDLHCDPGAVYEALKSLDEIRPGIRREGTRLPGCFDPFEMAVRAVLGQQITVKAARTLATRVVDTLGTPLATGVPGLTRLFPTTREIAALGDGIENRLGVLGITSTRSRTILALARALTRGALDFESCADPEAEMVKLTALPGIGPWTAGYLALRALEWPDVFLETDAGVKKAMGSRTPAEALALAEFWRPWRGYAVMNLWNSL